MPWQRLQRWLHGMASPALFVSRTEPLRLGLQWCAPPLLLAATLWGLGWAPTDARQGDSYRIIYVHVPAAAISQLLYLACALAGLAALVWRVLLAGILLRCLAPLGVAMTALALFSGAVWGLPTWGTWWLWSDPRLLSSLVQLLLFLGLVALMDAFDDEQRGERAGAVLALVGAANLPVIKYSVEWWSSIHQPASIGLGESSLHPAILWPLLACMLGWGLLVAWGALLRVQEMVMRRYRERVRLG